MVFSGVSASFRQGQKWRWDGAEGDRVTALCFALVVLVVLVCSATGIIVRAPVYSDSGYGFMVWDAFRHGAPFNDLYYPDPADLSKSIAVFITTWAPGQYLVPGVLEWLGLDLGLATMLVVTAFSIAGLVGWYMLYRAFGFPARTAMIAMAITACTRHFTLPFGFYNGGETLLFGAAPWFLLMVWRLRDAGWIALPALVAGGLAMIFFKLSGLILAASVIPAAALCGDRAWLKTGTIWKGLIAGLAVAAIGILFYVFWFSRGWSVLTAATHTDWFRLVSHGSFALSATWSGAFSFGELGQYVFLHPGRPLLQSAQIIYYATLPLAVGSFAFVGWRLRHSHADYLRFVFLAAAATLGALVLTWVRGAEVSLEERHFAPISMLLLVGMVHAFMTVRGLLVPAGFVAVAGLASIYGLASFVSHARENVHEPLGARGYRQHILSAEALAYIHTVDVLAPDGTRPLIVVPSPEIAPEVRTARVMSKHADFEDIDELMVPAYHGHVSRLYVFIQKRLVANGKADAILRSFVDYPRSGWREIPLGSFVCFSNGT